MDRRRGASVARCGRHPSQHAQRRAVGRLFARGPRTGERRRGGKQDPRVPHRPVRGGAGRPRLRRGAQASAASRRRGARRTGPPAPRSPGPATRGPLGGLRPAAHGPAGPARAAAAHPGCDGARAIRGAGPLLRGAGRAPGRRPAFARAAYRGGDGAGRSRASLRHGSGNGRAASCCGSHRCRVARALQAHGRPAGRGLGFRRHAGGRVRLAPGAGPAARAGGDGPVAPDPRAAGHRGVQPLRCRTHGGGPRGMSPLRRHRPRLRCSRPWPSSG